VNRLGPRSRAHPGFWAFLLHRVSGIALALFLPLHFVVLGLAIEGEARLDGFLRWTDRPSVLVAEALLVGLLALHLAGGLRLLALEFLPWFDRQGWLIALAGGGSLAVGLGFLLLAVAG